MSFQSDELLILLGAGASGDAGIPTSGKMITDLEGYLNTNQQWAEFKELYHYVKSAILYSDGIRGRFGTVVNYNIERVVNTLKELAKSDDHTVYPFIGNWNMILVQLAGEKFSRVSELDRLIINQLKRWVVLPTSSNASYYLGLNNLVSEYALALRVFTLNYDLCVEKICDTQNMLVERGFNDDRKWDYTRFSPSHDSNVGIFLYKMHGSIDWKRDHDGDLSFVDDVSLVEDPLLIFGTNYKLQYIDPYLFYAYEFRRCTLLAKLIVTIGYGYGDEHINGIIAQAMKQRSDSILLSVGPKQNGQSIEERTRAISDALGGTETARIKMEELHAKEFLDSKLNLAYLTSLVPEEFSPLD